MSRQRALVHNAATTLRRLPRWQRDLLGAVALVAVLWAGYELAHGLGLMGSHWTWQLYG